MLHALKVKKIPGLYMLYRLYFFGNFYGGGSEKEAGLDSTPANYCARYSDCGAAEPGRRFLLLF